MLTKTFGLRKEDQSTYSSLAHETPELFKHLLSEPGLSSLVNAMVDQISNHIADFVTFNSSEADQMDWERSAGVEIVEDTKGQTFAETDLMSLIRNFVAKTANPALFGTDFVENSPEFWELLWKFDEGIVPMAADVPGWIPWPRVQRARAAQRAMLARTREFEVAMDKHLSGEDPGPRWQDMDNISEYVKSRIGLFKAHGLSLEARASCDLALAWAMNANANTLVAWLLFELYRDPVLLEVVREEIASFVRFEQPQNDFGPAVWVAPKLEEPDVDGLINDCPHLKAAYLETLRIYTGIWTVKKLTEDVVLERRGKHAETYLLQKGHMAHLAHELHQFDAEYFDSPHEWRHDRFLKASGGQTVQLAGMSTLRPFGEDFHL